MKREITAQEYKAQEARLEKRVFKLQARRDTQPAKYKKAHSQPSAFRLKHVSRFVEVGMKARAEQLRREGKGHGQANNPK